MSAPDPPDEEIAEILLASCMTQDREHIARLAWQKGYEAGVRAWRRGNGHDGSRGSFEENVRAIARSDIAMTEYRKRELLRAVVAKVADVHQVTATAIMGRSRYKSVARARMVVMFELRGLGFSYPEVGRLVGRDHTTVMAAVRRCRALGVDPVVRLRVEDIA